MTLSVEQQADLAALAYELGHNPQTRHGLAHLVNKVDPQRARASFPDVVQHSQFQQLEQKVERRFAQAEAEKQKAAREAQRGALRDRYSDEQITEIEKEMTRAGTSNWEDGAILYAAKNPASDPRYQPPPQDAPNSKWEFPTVPGKDGKPMSFKEFAHDPKTASNNTAYQMIHQFRNQNLSSGFRR
jgi:hypothetical protein